VASATLSHACTTWDGMGSRIETVQKVREEVSLERKKRTEGQASQTSHVVMFLCFDCPVYHELLCWPAYVYVDTAEVYRLPCTGIKCIHTVGLLVRGSNWLLVGRWGAHAQPVSVMPSTVMALCTPYTHAPLLSLSTYKSPHKYTFRNSPAFPVMTSLVKVIF
jgi:hypothetical protein